MGFAPVAATAILMLTGVFAASVYWEDWHASQKTVEDAERQAARLRDERVHTSLTLVGTNYVNGPDRFTVTLQNDGSTVLRASEIDWVVDGVWRNDVIETTTVDGDPAGDVWLPGTQLVVEFRPITTQPTALTVTAGNGAKLVEAV